MVTVTAAFSLRGILAHVEGADRLQAGDDDDQVDHQGQDGAAYEEVGDFHGRPVQLFSGVGVFLEVGGQLVVDHHRLAVAQFEDAGADDRLPLLDPAGDGDEVAALGTEAHELLAQHLSLLIRGVLDDEDRVPVRGVQNGRCRNGEHLLPRGKLHRHVGEHAGAQLVAAVGHGRLHLDLAGVGFDKRVYGGDPALQRLPRQGIGGYLHGQAKAHHAELLLGQGESRHRSGRGTAG